MPPLRRRRWYQNRRLSSPQYSVLPSLATPPDHPLLPTSRLLNYAPLHSPPPPCTSPEPHLQGTPLSSPVPPRIPQYSYPHMTLLTPFTMATLVVHPLLSSHIAPLPVILHSMSLSLPLLFTRVWSFPLYLLSVPPCPAVSPPPPTAPIRRLFGGRRVRRAAFAV